MRLGRQELNNILLPARILTSRLLANKPVGWETQSLNLYDLRCKRQSSTSALHFLIRRRTARLKLRVRCAAECCIVLSREGQARSAITGTGR